MARTFRSNARYDQTRIRVNRRLTRREHRELDRIEAASAGLAPVARAVNQ